MFYIVFYPGTGTHIAKEYLSGSFAVAVCLMVVERNSIVITEDIEFVLHAGEQPAADLYGTAVFGRSLPRNSVIRQAFFSYAEINKRVMSDKDSA